MATKPKRNQATSPSRTKRGGGSTPKRKAPAKAKPTPTEDTPTPRNGLPARAERMGTRRIHSRELTASQSQERQKREATRREDEKAAQVRHRQGLQAKLAERGRPRRVKGSARGN